MPIPKALLCFLEECVWPIDFYFSKFCAPFGYSNLLQKYKIAEICLNIADWLFFLLYPFSYLMVVGQQQKTNYNIHSGNYPIKIIYRSAECAFFDMIQSTFRNLFFKS